ncbi:phenylalanine--tRNA ligase subunit beta [Patescibacteria group bacterium]|nr:phenylalanine--tRNA ligase subunit beta [Patescibacteria group bacterium]
MKVSRAWLQKYFDEPLPEGQRLADAFTFHSFEVEEEAGDLIDLKVLPDRAGYALSHRGVAYELAAALQKPLERDPLLAPPSEQPATGRLKVEIEDSQQCARYAGALVEGVTVGPSPAWLKEALESVGQRSINNVVDATNYVMLDIGQPLHAFDADKLTERDGAYAIRVRSAKEGEQITTLTGDAYELSGSILLITDAHADAPLGIAGIKGGKAAEVTSGTKNLIVESANFDGSAVRRASQRLKLVTDASVRFQNRPSPEFVAYGMRDVLALITSIAGGTLAGVTDAYPSPAVPKPVSVSLGGINGLLGSSFTKGDVESVWKRLALPFMAEGEAWTITPPFPRTDLGIPEDLIEEVGRILGYDRIAPDELPTHSEAADQARFRGRERMKDQLVEQGFTEVSTQSFAKSGDRELANPLDKKMPALRKSLEKNLGEALTLAKHYAPLVLPPGAKPKLFEVGTVFTKDGEHLELRMTEAPAAWGKDFPTVDNLSEANLEEYGRGYAPKRYALGNFKPYSAYPFVVRDIAMWVPAGKTDDDARAKLAHAVTAAAGSLSVKSDFLDRFEKDGRVSLAERLVFQSMERTLTDEEVNGIMEKIYAALRAAGYEIR